MDRLAHRRAAVEGKRALPESDRPGTSKQESFARADERRRIARELHDSTSQLLVVLQLQLHQLGNLSRPEAEPLIHECQETIKEIRQQIRSLDLE